MHSIAFAVVPIAIASPYTSAARHAKCPSSEILFAANPTTFVPTRARSRILLQDSPPFSPPPKSRTGDYWSGGDDDAGLNLDIAALFLSLWTRYNAALLSKPLCTSVATAGVLNALGDVLAQCLTSLKSCGLDLARISRYGIFGSIVAGPMGCLWFAVLERAFRQTVGIRAVLGKTAADTLLFSPFFLVLFFSGMAIMNGGGMEEVKGDLRAKVPATWVACCNFWPFINIVSFSVVPPPLRVLFINGISVFWVAFLSAVNSAGLGGGILGEEVEAQ